jgi:hypothetical protein
LVSTETPAQTEKNDRNIQEQIRTELKKSESISTTTLESSETYRQEDNFFTLLFNKNYITYQEAFAAFIVINGSDKELQGFQSQFEHLKGLGFLPPTITGDISPDKLITKGETAYITMKMLRMRGGITSSVLGLNVRRAFNELRYEGMMWKGYWQEPVSGREFVWSLSKAAEKFIGKTKE